jgi:hypothetical protein
MAKVKIKVQDDTWVECNADLDRLRDAGYSAAACNGKFVLYRIDEVKVRFKAIGEFDTVEELNRMINLIVGDSDG